MSHRESVEFKTIDGLTLRGHFYPASLSTRSPAVVMTPGFNITRDMHLPNIAYSFQASGISSLVYDPRTIGSSDGEPRNNINPALQVSDYHDALTFVKSHPRVDPDALIYWGFSFAGSVALCAAALDKRAKAVIAVNPLTTWDLPPTKREKVLAKTMRDRESQIAGNPAFRVPMLTDDGENPAGFGAGGTGLEELRLLKEAKERVVEFEETTTLQTYYHIVAWCPFKVVRFMGQTAVLIVSGEEDRISPIAKQRQVLAGPSSGDREEPTGVRDMFVLQGKGHLDVFDGEGLVAVMKKQVEFVQSLSSSRKGLN